MNLTLYTDASAKHGTHGWGAALHAEDHAELRLGRIARAADIIDAELLAVREALRFAHRGANVHVVTDSREAHRFLTAERITSESRARTVARVRAAARGAELKLTFDVQHGPSAHELQRHAHALANAARAMPPSLIERFPVLYTPTPPQALTRPHVRVHFTVTRSRHGPYWTVILDDAAGWTRVWFERDRITVSSRVLSDIVHHVPAGSAVLLGVPPSLLAGGEWAALPVTLDRHGALIVLHPHPDLQERAQRYVLDVPAGQARGRKVIRP